MRYEQNGTSLWYGTPDAPAPEGDLPASPGGRSTGIAVTVGVRPIAARNTVELRYRVNGGAAVRAQASLARTDVNSGAQYYVATLPEFRLGDTVNYLPVVSAPGLQVAAGGDIARFPSSFRIVAAATGGPSPGGAGPEASESRSAGLPPAGKEPAASHASAARHRITGHSKLSLTKAQLLALYETASSTLSEIQAHNPSLAAALQGKVLAQEQATVNDAFAGCSPKLSTAVRKIDLTPAARGTLTLRQTLVDGFKAEKLDPPTAREALARVNRLSRLRKLPDSAHTPVRDNPLFHQELSEAAVYKITDAVRVAESKASALVAVASAPEWIDDRVLTRLVDEKILAPDEAIAIGLFLNLYHLTSGSIELSAVVKKRAARWRDVLQLSVADWEHAIAAAHASPPTGLDIPGYAAALRRAATQDYPTDALLALSGPATAASLAQAIAASAPVTAKNAAPFGQPFEKLDTSGVAAHAVAAVQNAHTQLSLLVNQHPGLRLAGILNSNAAPEDQAAAITARLSALQELRDLNPDTEFMGLDYTKDSADTAGLKTDGIEPAHLHLAIEDFKATQRVHMLAGDVDHTRTLMSAGYASAHSIASERYDRFLQRSGLPEPIASQHYLKATDALTRSLHMALSALSAAGDIFHHLNVGNAHSDIHDYLKSIPGFSEFFGNQDYCKCTECQSIIGPAAYFVDLMSFIEQNILSEVFRGSKAADQLNLKVRRHDLWNLRLTCTNTNALIPYLDIIDEVLENYIATQRGFTGDLSHRELVERAVYQHALAVSHSSFRQPFTLALVQLDTYLEYFSVSRAQIARTLLAPDPVIVRAALKISHAEYNVLIQPKADFNSLKSVYAAGLKSGVKEDAFVDVRDMLNATGYSRAQLGAVLATRFVTHGGAVLLQIKSEKSSSASVQNDRERIHGMTLDRLDRLHRFTRLLRATGWSSPELDLVLAQIESADLAKGISDATLSRIAQILSLQSRWSLTLDQNCALWSDIPQVALDPAQGSLFDGLFNFEPFRVLDGTLPRPSIRFVHSSLRASGTPLPADSTTHRLIAGLQVSDRDLASLIANLAPALGARLDAADDAERGFLLTPRNLGLLYRHALAARLLSIPVDDLFQLIQLAQLAHQHLATLDDLLAVLDFYDWYQSSGYSLDDLGVITHGSVRKPTSYPDKIATAQSLVAGSAREHALEFADTVFAFSPGVTEAQSRQIISANGGLFERVPKSPTSALRLTSAFQPRTAITIPANIPVTPADAAAALLKYHPSQLIPPRLAGILNIDPGIVATLIKMTSVDLGSDAMIKALQGGLLDPVVDLVDRLIPLKVLFSASGYDADGLNFIAQNSSLFCITSFADLTVPIVRKLSVYSTAAANLADAGPSRTALSAFSPAHFFNGADPKAMAAALGIDRRVLATLLPHVTLPGSAPEAFAALSAVAALAAKLGVGGETLVLTLSENYDQQARANQAILSAIRARFPVQKDFLTRLRPLDDRIRSAKRDALTDYILRSMGLAFQTLDDLYNYFLLDVQKDGCAQTSRVVAAISSVQLYVYRCLMNLEQDRRDPSDAAHIRVPPQSIPADEWEWRQNFRVWQANRKVFLFPETYLEPSLRDDKTPLFEDLESNLLQQPINEHNVLDAYSTYLSGFDQVSKLQIAGSYQDAQTDTLHLFGVTPDDPPAYFYRTIENVINGEKEPHQSTLYSPWLPVSVQIPVREVSPVVYLGRLFVFWTEVKTRSVNTILGGNSQFSGYKHRLSLKYTALRPDRNWTAPQTIALNDKTLFPSGDGIVDDPLDNPLPWENEMARQLNQPVAEVAAKLDALHGLGIEPGADTPLYDTKDHLDTQGHPAPQDDYTLQGFQWDRVYPRVDSTGLILTGRNFSMRAGVDFYNKQIRNLGPSPRHIHLRLRHSSPPAVLCARLANGSLELYTGTQSSSSLDDYAWYSVVADERRIDRLADTAETAPLVPSMKQGLYSDKLGTLDPGADIAIINNSPADAILDQAGDLLLLQGAVRPQSHLLRRLSTTLGESLSRKLFTGGVHGLLEIDTQTSLQESGPSFQITGNVENAVVTGTIDFKGAFGNYFREIFFHVPNLIATQLNSQGHFQAAQEWYQYIFNPTVDETVHPPKGTPPARADKMARDRAWRYLEFRGLDVPKLRKILTDPAAIEAYKKDPFNPHAIARLRLSAYQKCVVMKYIDNLIDWADSLFREFTMESVNEATLLYVTALEILGPRPAEIGSCGQISDESRTYEKIAPLIGKGSEFLVELETYTLVRAGPVHHTVHLRPKRVPKHVYTLPRIHLTHHLNEAVAVHKQLAVQMQAKAAASSKAGPATVFPGQSRTTSTPRAATRPKMQIRHAAARPAGHVMHLRRPSRAPTHKGHVVHLHSLVRQISPVFCIPPNTDFLAYWDRVEGQLYKIRNCMDIAGAKRQLALFAPPIDPRLLVAARAAGLSLEDVLSSLSGDLPPYRFTYLIEKAKQYAGQVQSFGSMLLSAVEKRDAEQLNMLRLTHQKNIEAMTTKVRQFDIDTANNTIDAMNAQRATVQYRHDYYQGLVSGGLSTWENVQADARHTASTGYALSVTSTLTAALLYLIPRMGSPFALVFGGKDLGDNMKAYADATHGTATIAEAIATSAGLVAGFERRSDEWQHQIDLAQNELAQIDKQLAGANIRLQAALREMDIHQKTIDQTDEIYDFSRNRFSNLGLYTWLATTMQRVHRNAYNCAYAMAKLAEQAYRFERNDQDTPLLTDNYWNSQHAGLLAGETLLADLHDMERRFIETNYRLLEIDQSFSLAQIAPAALLALRESGLCDFSIAEVFFDLFYPGQYCRRIKAVRLTIPCVTGPFTNVSATLTLTRSQVRLTPERGSGNLIDVPLQRTVSIAASTAQSDSGVFEFSFRDERYMPFEGAGAVSGWNLQLPNAFRQFDYQTISDVILRISYTAEQDGMLREEVEKENASLEGTILKVLKDQPLARLFSFRQDFSTVFHRLLHSSANTPVTFTISDKHFPIFLHSRSIRVTSAELLLRIAASRGHAPELKDLKIAIDDTVEAAFAPDPTKGNLLSCDLTTVFAAGIMGDHTITVLNAGDLAPSVPKLGDRSAIDDSKLLDVMIYVEFELS
jgi:hypothetical protein